MDPGPSWTPEYEDEQSMDTYVPPKRFWTLLGLGFVFLWASFQVHDAFFGLFLLTFVGNIYSNYVHMEEQKIRERTLDTLEQL